MSKNFIQGVKKDTHIHRYSTKREKREKYKYICFLERKKKSDSKKKESEIKWASQRKKKIEDRRRWIEKRMKVEF